ncbi:flagellar hook-basal body complex protein FliE [Anaeroselena agilis]|uniref:Flagellar hook-basal body complex protein FliE n=1 Tax=Anaeroselena agilis TaxID=3063788 RepID=A0ABU3NWV1_9FIRM|nr:flagellar hook-basal body complex protein FliE [Selenomonadales bacterium 4137-cl]
MRVDRIALAPAGADRTAAGASPAGAEGGKSFGQFLADSLGEVNKLQGDAQQASMNLAAGKIQDVSEVVIATEKASIALQLTMQVRNKVVEAYHEMMRMQV